MRYSRTVQEEYSYAPPIKKPDNSERLIRPTDLLFILQVASALAAHVHSSHVHMYAPEDSLSCRLEATRMILSKGVICRPDKRQRHQAKKLCVVRNDRRDGVILA
ncbi:hypothetical protein AH332_02015 [Salmonella enterica subsp. salamae]|nr:hypothetical protein [Salmonella enterica subsp. salamae]